MYLFFFFFFHFFFSTKKQKTESLGKESSFPSLRQPPFFLMQEEPALKKGSLPISQKILSKSKGYISELVTLLS